MIDITNRKQTEDERAQILERECANNRAKDEFLATVSHELRTPLTNMRMAIQMLQVATQPQQQQRYLQILQSECTREVKLINDLLDLQQLEAGVTRVDWVNVSLSNWLPLIVEPFMERFADRQQTLHLNVMSEIPDLTSDLTYLERIVSELLNNACKYTPLGGEIAVTARSIATEAQSNNHQLIELIISNSGVEIPTSKLERIFDKFYRITSHDPWRQKGTGLGLALIAKLVKVLGGTIRAESNTNSVSFIITLGNPAFPGLDRPLNSNSAISTENSNDG
jgi:signal transduction histidine kinase